MFNIIHQNKYRLMAETNLTKQFNSNYYQLDPPKCYTVRCSTSVSCQLKTHFSSGVVFSLVCSNATNDQVEVRGHSALSSTTDTQTVYCRDNLSHSIQENLPYIRKIAAAFLRKSLNMKELVMVPLETFLHGSASLFAILSSRGGSFLVNILALILYFLGHLNSVT